MSEAIVRFFLLLCHRVRIMCCSPTFTYSVFITEALTCVSLVLCYTFAHDVFFSDVVIRRDVLLRHRDVDDLFFNDAAASVFILSQNCG